MAVTLHTIPPQTGELVRALIAAHSGGSDQHYVWYNTRGGASEGSVSADSDLHVTDDKLISRVRWQTTHSLLINADGGDNFSALVQVGNALDGKHLLIATDDTSPFIDVRFADRGTTGGSYINLPITETADIAACDAVAAGDLVNIVISDAPVMTTVTGIPASAHLAAGAPTIAAAAAVFDTALLGEAHFRAGPPTIAARARLIGGLAAEAHLRAGAPRIAASATIFDLALRGEARLTAGVPSIRASARLIGGVRTEAHLAAGIPRIAASATVFDTVQRGEAHLAAGAPGIAADGTVFDTVQRGEAHLVAGAPTITAHAEVFTVPRPRVPQSDLLAEAAGLEQEILGDLEMLVPVTLHHGGTDLDLMVLRDGPSGVSIDTDRDEPANRWRITIYDQVLVQPDDEISWGPSGYDETDPVYRHGVVRVRGLSKADESRYVTVAETN